MGFCFFLALLNVDNIKILETILFFVELVCFGEGIYLKYIKNTGIRAQNPNFLEGLLNQVGIK